MLTLSHSAALDLASCFASARDHAADTNRHAHATMLTEHLERLHAIIDATNGDVVIADDDLIEDADYFDVR